MLVFSIRKHWLSHLWEIIRSLANNDGDVNENGKKVIGLDWQNSKSARASRLFVRFFTVTAWLRPREMQNFTYCGEREYKTTTLLFFSWTFLKSFRIQLQHLTNWTRWNKCDEFAVLFIPSFYVLSAGYFYVSLDLVAAPTGRILIKLVTVPLNRLLFRRSRCLCVFASEKSHWTVVHRALNKYSESPLIRTLRAP